MKIKNLTAEMLSNLLYTEEIYVQHSLAHYFLSTLGFYGEHGCRHSLQEMSYDIYVVPSLFSNQIWVQ